MDSGENPSLRRQLNILKNLDIKTVNLTENNFDVFKKIINKDCCIIDALFGIGLKRNIGGIYKRAIEVVNEKAGFTIALFVCLQNRQEFAQTMGRSGNSRIQRI